MVSMVGGRYAGTTQLHSVMQQLCMVWQCSDVVDCCVAEHGGDVVLTVLLSNTVVWIHAVGQHEGHHSDGQTQF